MTQTNALAINTDALFFTSLVTPDAIERARTALAPAIAAIAAIAAARSIARIYFVGGGASLAAMHGAKYLLDRFSTVAADVATGWQFVSRAPLGVNEQAIVLLTSYSGETPEVLAARQLAEARGAIVVAVTNSDATPLARGAPFVLDFESKAVFTAPLAIVYLLSAALMRTRGERSETAVAIAAGVDRLPDQTAALAARSQAAAAELATRCAEVRSFYVLGTGPNYGLAYKLALSVIIENLWLDAAPIDAGEFYHGPIEIIPPTPPARDDRCFLHLVGTDRARQVSEQAIAFCRQRGARQIIFDARDAPEFGELFSPFALFAPTEWWVMHMAVQKHHDVDERRYMGKIGGRWGEYG